MFLLCWYVVSVVFWVVTTTVKSSSLVKQVNKVYIIRSKLYMLVPFEKLPGYRPIAFIICLRKTEQESGGPHWAKLWNWSPTWAQLGNRSPLWAKLGNWVALTWSRHWQVLSRSRHSQALSRSWHWSVLWGWSRHWSELWGWSRHWSELWGWSRHWKLCHRASSVSCDWRAWLQSSQRAWAIYDPGAWLRSGRRTRQRAGSGPDTPQTLEDTFPPT